MARFLTRRRLLVAGGAAAAAAPLATRSSARAVSVTGALKVLDTPVRVFDSRQPVGPLNGAKLDAGQAVAVTVSGAYEGDELATAVFVNITITDTEGWGFLVVRADDLSGMQPIPQSSNINWSADGLTLANLTLSRVGGEHAIEVRCGGAGRTHVICDVQGYMPFVV